MKLRYGYAAGWIALGVCVVLLMLGVVRNPVQGQRQQFAQRMAELTTPEFDSDFASDPEFEAWQKSVSTRPKLWGPLVAAPQAVAAPPALQEMLAGVEPTRNKLGSGESLKIQISVDGKKDWFTKGQQVKGCTLEEITEGDVLFTLVQGGQKHGMRLPRK